MASGGAGGHRLDDRLSQPERTALRGAWADRAALEAWLPWMWRRAPPIGVALAAANPVYIPRNFKVEEALAAAEAGDLAPVRGAAGGGAGPMARGRGWRPMRCRHLRNSGRGFLHVLRGHEQIFCENLGACPVGGQQAW